MYNKLKKLYDENKIDLAALSRAVNKGWITEDEYYDITGDGLSSTA